MKDNAMHIHVSGIQLRNILLEREMTTAEFSREIGVSWSTAKNWQTGKTSLNRTGLLIRERVQSFLKMVEREKDDE